jgi:hypothetical protein
MYPIIYLVNIHRPVSVGRSTHSGPVPSTIWSGRLLGDSVVPKVAHEEGRGSRVGVSSFIISRNNQPLSWLY